MHQLLELAKTLDEKASHDIASEAAPLVEQSRTIILKPSEEPARQYLCCVLAAEMLALRRGTQPPSATRPPIPPAKFKKLLEIFRETLGPPAKRRVLTSPQKKSAPSTPRKPVTPRSNVTPSRSRGSCQTRSSGRRVELATIADAERIGCSLGLNTTTTSAVANAYGRYHDLVKDTWGLLLGLFYVVVARAEPGRLEDVSLRIRSLVPVPDASERQDQWVYWCERIVAGRSWLSSIAVVEGPTRELYCDSGQWKL